jgi:small nuclear ribonucleoprotein (snRNP)-like protein
MALFHCSLREKHIKYLIKRNERRGAFMKKATTKYLVCAGSAILICLLFLAVSTESSAQTAAAQGVGYNVAASLKDNLKSLTDKDIYVSLRSGKVYQGRLKSVGEHLIHLEKIAGRDFYDALIRIDDISAIEARFRDLK